jgi:inner membrane protein
MDSVSQIALGAAVSVAVMGRRTAGHDSHHRGASLCKAAAWGAVAGTLPDLDVFIDHGDAIRNMVLHRAETHALLWLTLFSLPLAALVARLHREGPRWKRWWLALWLALVTHPLLDAMTVYGTQLGLPFTNHPYGVGSVFIIDPLYTLPLLVGTAVTLATQRLRANAIGLTLATAYLGWGVLAQQHVHGVARETLAAQGIAAERVLVTPTPFNTIAWRVVVMQREHYLEGFWSLLDGERRIAFDRFDRGAALEPAAGGIDGVRRIAAFSRGFYALRQDGPRVLVTDLRMGQQPNYTFSFAVAEQASPLRPLQVPVQVSSTRNVDRLLPWLWRRIGGDTAPPPR